MKDFNQILDISKTNQKTTKSNNYLFNINLIHKLCLKCLSLIIKDCCFELINTLSFTCLQVDLIHPLIKRL